MPTTVRPTNGVGSYFQGSLATFVITTIRSAGEPAGFTNPMMRIEDLGTVTTLTGTVTIAPGTTAVVGIGTLFTTELAVGDTVLINGATHDIAVITDDLNLTLATTHVGGATNADIASYVVTVILPTINMDRAPEGYYFLDWEVPTNLTAGQYVAVFSSDLEGQVFEKSQLISIKAMANTALITQQILNQNKENELMVGLYYMVKETQEIPVWHEQGLIKNNGLKACFTFDRWNIFYNKTAIYRNDEQMTDGFTIDYDGGEVTFDSPLTEFDTVHADYNFSWFSGEEMSWFMNLALQEINVTPPGSQYSIGTIPITWSPGVIYGAAINVLRRLIHDLSYQQPQIVYGLHPDQYGSGGGGGLANGLENFKYLKENYEKIFESLKKDIKRANWPSIGIIVAPEFTMPGGRSRWFRYLYKGGS